MPIFKTAQFTVRPELVEKCKQAILEFMALCGAHQLRHLQYAIDCGDMVFALPCASCLWRPEPLLSGATTYRLRSTSS